MRPTDRIYVAGHQGLVGSALVRRLMGHGYANILTIARDTLDLRDQLGVFKFFASMRPDYVFLAAARVGGILANNSLPADFIRDNLEVQTNVIDAAHRNNVKKLLFLGSSCIYPRECPQPIKESYLWTGPLEPTNSAYAVAKLAGIEMLRAYWRQHGFQSVVAMPTNLYGPYDNYDPESAHVLPALIRKIHMAKIHAMETVTIWGTGNPRREFLHVDDCAEACVRLMLNASGRYNVGSGEDLTIAELAMVIADVVGYQGSFVFDDTKPDGMPQKLLDVSRIRALGWAPSVALSSGIAQTYQCWMASGT